MTGALRPAARLLLTATTMLAHTTSYALLGIDAVSVRVEVDVVPGLPTFTVVGLPDSAVRESRNRVASALSNSGYEFPLRRITVNLAPASLRKEGSAFDLPIALGILAATGQLRRDALTAWSSLGELSLTGELRPVRGILCAAIAQRAAGCRRLIVPSQNANEARLVPGALVEPASSLAEAAGLVQSPARVGRRAGLACTRPDASSASADRRTEAAPEMVTEGPLSDSGEWRDGTSEETCPDLSEVKGQAHAKRALELAAAGGHNVLLEGPPGSGKSMLARRIPGILPPMTAEEILETTRIHSVAGTLRADRPVVLARPFRRPHHTVSQAGLIGGGSVPRPGEVSLAHNGVLFLDELPEFSRGVLEVLRQPIEEGCVTIARARLTLTYPARFMLVAAMNPCNCGDLTHPDRACRCSEADVRRYRGRISGPLLDRIDLHVEVPPVPVGDLAASITDATGRAPAARSESVAARERVERARSRQLERYAEIGIYCNAQLGTHNTRQALRADSAALDLLARAARAFHLSARAYHRTLRVARTIADLEGADPMGVRHVSEALQYRPAAASLGCQV